MKQKPLGLPKNCRIKKRKAVDALFTGGQRLTVPMLRVQWMLVQQLPDEPNLQVAFSVPKKAFKKAVQRNRIKRLLRENWRLQKAVLEQSIPPARKLMLFIIFSGTELPDYNFVFEKTTALLQKLKLAVTPK